MITQIQTQIQVLWTNNEREYFNPNLRDYVLENTIIQQLVVLTPHNKMGL